MQLLVLGLFVAVYLHDLATTVEVTHHHSLRFAEALPRDTWPGLSVWAVALAVLLPKLFVALSYGWACRRTRKQLGTQRGQCSLNRLETMTNAIPLLLLCLFIVDLSAGALQHLRVPLQHTVLADELLIMFPTLFVVAWAWAAYYPVDRRLREAAIFREADAGRPIYPLLTRRAYVVMQLRHQFGLLLLPLLAVSAWSEAVTLMGPNFDGPLSAQAVSFLSPLGVFVVFLGAPLIIRHVWQTRPLPAGDVRNRMLALCEQHNVRVRELLLWQTSGRMVNAAVTGLVSHVRYILLSDGLLDQLDPPEVEAVMAHELAHVKCKHIIWMGLSLIVTLVVFESLFGQIVDLANVMYATSTFDLWGPTGPLGFDLYNPDHRMLATALPSFVVAILIFGWISRRIERQADVFAVRHLAMNIQDKQYNEHGKQVFDDISVRTMVSALQRVAELNHAPTHRKSWRHGSIAWRQDHLRSLVGHAIDPTPVDRVLMRVKLVTLAGLALTITLYFL